MKSCDVRIMSQTPLAVIAHVSRIVTKVVDRLTGDRADYPLMVAGLTVEALQCLGIESRIMYGEAAWIEILEDQTPIWAGCWEGNIHFWVATQFGEIVDLNTSVAHRKRGHQTPQWKALYSPPIVWSAELPKFYRYIPEGVAEIELTEEKDRKRYESAVAEIREKCVTNSVNLSAQENELDFPSEAILCPGRRILDDPQQSFAHFDRALSVRGIPQGPL